MAIRFVGRAILIVLCVIVGDECSSDRADVSSKSCGGIGAANLDHLFQGRVGQVVGGDYVRAYGLPTGDKLFVMQDAFVARTNQAKVRNLAHAKFIHNAAVLVRANGCVSKTLTGVRSYLGDRQTSPLSHWFWAMGGEVGADGLLHIMVAEMQNLNGSGASTGAIPIATWHAKIDPRNLTVRSFRPATDDTAELYGWAVASDDSYTYLYGYCYRQFVPGEFLGHDPQCAARVRVARVPRGQFDAPMEYYTEAGWRADPSTPAAIDFPGQRAINPISVQRVDGRFVSVSKEGDWWGTTIFIDSAPTAAGPWTTVTTIAASPRCDGCNTYYASLMPWRDHGALIVGLSNNAWDMRAAAYPNPSLYRPSFSAVRIAVDT